MTFRVLAYITVTIVLLVVGYFATFSVSLGNCGMGPDAEGSCYDAQTPWVWATIAAFVAADLAAAFLIFRGRKKS